MLAWAGPRLQGLRGFSLSSSSSSSIGGKNGPEKNTDQPNTGSAEPAGDLHQAEIRADEEGIRAERPVRLRDRPHHLQQHQPPLPVRQHRHGQGAAQVHGIQRAPREPHQLRHPRGSSGGWPGGGGADAGPRSSPRSSQTLKRKGLGLESHELELDEGPDPAEKARRLSEGMDLSVARPRFYSPAPLPEAAYGSSPPAADGSLGSTSGSPQGQGRPSTFKPAVPKPSGRSPGPLPPGIGYPLFPAGSLNRALATKTPPPLYLGAEGRRGEAHGSLASGRSGGSAARPLYPALQTLSPVLTPGSTGAPSHSLSGFPFLAPAQAEFGAGEAPPPPGFLQPGPTAWQHPRDMAALGVSSRIVPTEEPAPAPGTSPQHQAISIKSERVSPGLGCPSGTPHPALGSLASLSEASRGPGDLQPRDDYAKGYPYPLGPPRPLAEEQRSPVPTRRAQAMDTWQR
ncbi:myocyte-specific enhancer factor 2B isoform X1 [Grus americana]|uniref:myocyte-specific enhancer factor 2B isoform X1 n=1 Tax=Grus americana TaxID=9117 RepID=UPI0024083C9C|nr:myocyte-specific enhancer factor 2B isoform X1 [Grus americana]